MPTDFPQQLPPINPIIWHENESNNSIQGSKTALPAVQEQSSTLSTLRRKSGPSALWNSYYTALAAYSTVFHVPEERLSSLKQPFNYFYKKADKIRFIFPLSYWTPQGAFITLRFLTHDAWPYFLSYLSLPSDTNSEECIALFNALYSLLTTFQLSALDALLQQMHILNLPFSDSLSNAIPLISRTPDGLLLAYTKEPTCAAGYHYRLLNFQFLKDEFLKDEFIKKKSYPHRAFLRQLFFHLNEHLEKNLRKQNATTFFTSGKDNSCNQNLGTDCTQKKQRQPPAKKSVFPSVITYATSDQVYHLDYGTLLYSKVDSPALWGEKQFIIAPPIADIESEATHFGSASALLSTITGNSLATLYELCKLFFRIAKNAPGISMRDCLPIRIV